MVIKYYFYYGGSSLYAKSFEYGFIKLEAENEEKSKKVIKLLMAEKKSLKGDFIIENKEHWDFPDANDYDTIEEYYKDFRELCMSIRDSITFDEEDITYYIENNKEFSYQCNFYGKEKIMTPDKFKDINWEEEY